MPRQPNVSRQTLLVLELLLRNRRRFHYGYAISRETRLSSGTLYPILMRLREQGWLESQWEDSPEPGRPRRHTYRLTPDGAIAARERLSSRNAVLRPSAV